MLFMNRYSLQGTQNYHFSPYAQVVLLSIPLSLILPCYFYNIRLQQETLSCINWLLLFNTSVLFVVFEPYAYWFSIFFAHACQYTSIFFQRNSKASPFPVISSTILRILSWHIPALLAWICKGETLSLNTYTLLSLFIPEAAEIVCEFLCAFIQALGDLYQRCWLK